MTEIKYHIEEVSLREGKPTVYRKVSLYGLTDLSLVKENLFIWKESYLLATFRIVKITTITEVIEEA